MKRKTIILVFIVLQVFCLYFSVGYAYSDSVYNAQKKLKQLGYDPGPIDGIFGKKTKNAIKNFQADNYINVTGQLNNETKEKLGIQNSYRKVQTGQCKCTYTAGSMPPTSCDDPRCGPVEFD